MFGAVDWQVPQSITVSCRGLTWSLEKPVKTDTLQTNLQTGDWGEEAEPDFQTWQVISYSCTVTQVRLSGTQSVFDRRQGLAVLSTFGRLLLFNSLRNMNLTVGGSHQQMFSSAEQENHETRFEFKGSVFVSLNIRKFPFSCVLK